ncbi:unnamed protein product [Psylliodes chrysocephalus]|uniref:C2H2-type domain-containing protein n=1 Tax=Psylliodes chrysocephalus TaxID=3402493 RepID=A0A9P0D107_9CUCU|nr:unnamed protein product [Psylliodes chrysocephala]
MLCFLCKKKFDSSKILFTHFKRIHDLPDGIFRCCELECNQIFKNLGSFKKHINRKHINSALEIDLINNFNDFKNQISLNNSSNHDYNHTTASQERPLLYNETNFNQTQRISLDNSTQVTIISSNENPNCDVISDTKNNVCSQANDDNNSGFKSTNNLISQLELLKKRVHDLVIEFVLTLHNNSKFSRKDVLEIQECTTKFLIDPILDSLICFGKCNFFDNSLLYNNFFGMITSFRYPFELFSTDHLLFKTLHNKGYVDKVKEFVVNDEVRVMHKKGSLVADEKKITGVLMPLKFQFKTFFEKDGLLEKTLKHIEYLQRQTKLTNFIQGELWKTNMLMYPNKILLPYFIYIDDFEINNPLGSHSSKHSICNTYYSFPCLPVDESKLENIFHGAVIKSTDVKTFGNEKCFQSLIQELKELEVDGIEIQINENLNLRIHFILGLVLGDNLGLNSFLDFSKSFSANFFCRMCRLEKIDCQKLCIENTEMIRTISNYNSDLASSSENRGIICNSLLNDVPSFHVVHNYYVDIMHDVFEGVCHYSICHAINYFIKMKYFDLKILNSRRETFEYGPKEIGNMPGKIEMHHLNSKKLRMSAREMMTFITYFPLMVGDMIPADDDVWKFLINLIEIIDILLCFEVADSDIILLQNKIKKLNRDYTVLFDDTLKPKFHNLIHYPKIIRQSGPLRKLWCFKYESNHIQSKIYCHVINSRKNICITLSKKYQLKFTYQILKNKSTTILDANSRHKRQSNFKNIIHEQLHVAVDESCIQFYSQLNYKGVQFKCGDYISVLNNDILIYKVVEIIILNNEKVLFFSQKLINITYRSHFLAHEVDISNLGQFSLISVNELIGPPLDLIKTAKGINMIKVKEHYTAIAF